MSDYHDTFFGWVGCMDGRSVKALVRYGEERRENPDILCQGPGVVEILADSGHPEHGAKVDELRKQMLISAGKHGSVYALVCGHPSCAGCPRPDDEQMRFVFEAVEIVRRIAAELGYPDYRVEPGWNGPDSDGVWSVRRLDETELRAAA